MINTPTGITKAIRLAVQNDWS